MEWDTRVFRSMAMGPAHPPSQPLAEQSAFTPAASTQRTQAQAKPGNGSILPARSSTTLPTLGPDAFCDQGNAVLGCVTVPSIPTGKGLDGWKPLHCWCLALLRRDSGSIQAE
jgi:hypothetical protein